MFVCGLGVASVTWAAPIMYPTWIVTTGFDGGVVTMLTTVGWLAYEYSARKWLAAVVIGAAAVLIISATAYFHYVAHRAPTAETESTPFDHTILIDCDEDQLPSRFTTKGAIDVLAINRFGLEHSEIALFHTSGRPGEKIPFIQPGWTLGLAYKCAITNYGSQPVISFDSNFNIVTSKPNDAHYGFDPEKPARDPHFGSAVVHVAKIDTGIANKFEFYVVSDKLGEYAAIDIPQTASLMSLSGRAESRVKLVVPPLRTLLLAP
jgi:hypothetical protein